VKKLPTVLFSFKRLANGHIMFHGFTAPAKTSAEADLKVHAGGCPDFGPAFRAGDTIEFAREVESLPEFDGDELEDWLDQYFASDESEVEPIDMVRDPEDE
jgi:hypothetical protein